MTLKNILDIKKKGVSFMKLNVVTKGPNVAPDKIECFCELTATSTDQNKIQNILLPWYPCSRHQFHIQGALYSLGNSFHLTYFHFDFNYSDQSDMSHKQNPVCLRGLTLPCPLSEGSRHRNVPVLVHCQAFRQRL
jgi:hypothetical protein